MRLPDGRRLYTAQCEFGLDNHREDAPHFNKLDVILIKKWKTLVPLFWEKMNFAPPRDVN